MLGEKRSPTRAGAAQRSLHLPPMQLWLVVQTLPLAPQFLLSVATVAQSLLQALATQRFLSCGQTVSHPPQFAGSEVGSMQAPWQRNVPPTQRTSHLLSMQV